MTKKIKPDYMCKAPFLCFLTKTKTTTDNDWYFIYLPTLSIKTDSFLRGKRQEKLYSHEESAQAALTK